MLKSKMGNMIPLQNCCFGSTPSKNLYAKAYKSNKISECVL